MRVNRACAGATNSPLETIRLIELLAGHVALGSQRSQALGGAGCELEIGLGARGLLVRDRRTGALRGDVPSLGVELRLSQCQIGLRLRDLQLVGEWIDLKQDFTAVDGRVLADADLDDAARDGRCDMHHVRIDRGVAGDSLIGTADQSGSHARFPRSPRRPLA
jgi:hypothetical protein